MATTLMFHYLSSNFIENSTPDNNYILIYNKFGELKYEVNPNIAYFFSKTNYVVIREEGKTEVSLDFENASDALKAINKLNLVKSNLNQGGPTPIYIPLAGSNLIYGNLISLNNYGSDLGSITNYWRYVYASGGTFNYVNAGVIDVETINVTRINLSSGLTFAIVSAATTGEIAVCEGSYFITQSFANLISNYIATSQAIVSVPNMIIDFTPNWVGSGLIWHYSIIDVDSGGTNKQTGTIQVVYDASGNTEWTDTSTPAIGDVTCRLYPVNTAGNIYLESLTVIGNWSVTTSRIMI